MAPPRPGRTAPRSGSDTPGETPSLAAIRQVSELFKLVSQPYRLDILRVLDRGPRTVSAVLKEFPEVTGQSVSRHLVHLRVGGLVDNRTDGSFRVYSLTERGRWLVEAIAGLDPA